jgi:protein-arginine kinase
MNRYTKAMRTLGKGNRVEELMEGILRDLQLLTGSRVEKLAEAMKQLSSMKLSVPLEAMDNAPENFNTSTGIQNLNSGSGNLYK